MQFLWHITKVTGTGTGTHSKYKILLFCGTNGFVNVPQFYVYMGHCLLRSGLAWTFKLVPSKHTETSIWHIMPFTITFRDQHIVF